jgi:hypothetical protein
MKVLGETLADVVEFFGFSSENVKITCGLHFSSIYLDEGWILVDTVLNNAFDLLFKSPKFARRDNGLDF